MKKYTKKEARKLVLAGTHQVENDKVAGLLSYIIDNKYLKEQSLCFFRFKKNMFTLENDYEWQIGGFENLETIKLSQIIDEKAKIVNEEPKPKKMTFKYTDLQYKSKQGEWVNIEANGDYEMRLKPDYSKEIEALEKKAAEYGEKVIINFKSI